MTNGRDVTILRESPPRPINSAQMNLLSFAEKSALNQCRDLILALGP